MTSPVHDAVMAESLNEVFLNIITTGTINVVDFKTLE
jgi:hypothetical protein